MQFVHFSFAFILLPWKLAARQIRTQSPHRGNSRWPPNESKFFKLQLFLHYQIGFKRQENPMR